ncbi:MAG TPA: hypothetical protein VMD51_02580, partial [Mycobacterium sp.]|nr:hypothetical protein [Mycobacterium sp.]
SRSALRARGVVTVVFAFLADLEREIFESSEDRMLAEQAAVDMMLAVVNSAALSGSSAGPPQ